MVRFIYKFLLLSSIIFLGNACKPDATATKNVAKESTQNDPLASQPELPDPCKKINISSVAELLDVSENDVTFKSSKVVSKTTRSCFFRWPHPEVANAAILIQALGNPVPDEFPQWASAFIENKKSSGERTVEDPATAHKYVTLKGVGEHSCYSLEQSKCYFRKDDMVYLVALNGVDDDNTKMEIFKKLGNEVLTK